MANRFWVGGSATWDATAGTKWSTTTGGGGGASVPTAADNAIFDGNSGVGTVTVGATRVCLDFDSTNFGGTIAGAGALAVSGNFTWGAGITRSYTGALTFNAGAGTFNITSNGKTFGSLITFNDAGAGATWQLGDAFLSTTNLTVTQGTFKTNGKSIQTSRLLSTNSNVRAIDTSGSQWTITGNAANWDFTTNTNLTFTSDSSSSIVFANTTATNMTPQFGPFTYNDIYFQGTGTGRLAIAGNNSTYRDWYIQCTSGADFQCTATPINVRNIDFTGFAGSWVGTGGTYNISGDFTGNGSTVITATPTWVFVGTGTQNITMNGMTLLSPVRQDGVGGTTKLHGAFVTTGAFSLKNGTFDMNGSDATFNNVNLSLTGFGTRGFLFNGSGTLSLAGSSVVLNISGDQTGLTWQPDTGTIYIVSPTSTGGFVTGTLSFYNITCAGGGTGQFNINTGVTINKIQVNAGPYILQFQQLATTALGVGGLVVSGSAGNLVTLQTNGVQGTLSVPGGDVICDYVSVTNLNCVGGARFFMGTHSTDGGGNVGVRFTNQYRSPVPVWSGIVQ